MEIIIIDYNCGNLFSIHNAFESIGIKTKISSNKNEIANADALVLPGVGAFQTAMENLKETGIDQLIVQKVNAGTPIFGICLGMQLLFESSEEFGSHKGLGLLKGEVKALPSRNNDGGRIKIPHVGWNSIHETETGKWKNSPLRAFKPNEHMYFVHSYFVHPANQNDSLATSNYKGIEYCSAVLKDNIFAVQFHPEKSANAGLTIYKNWLALIK